MSHLGRWLTALVDEELEQAERDRVLNHLARCEKCLLEANALRAVKRRMSTLGDVAATDAVTGKLLDLSHGHAAGPAVGPAPRRRGLPGLRWLGSLARTRLRWRLTAGLTGGMLAVLGTVAFLIGGVPSGSATPQVTPAVQAYWTQHSYDAGQVPTTGASSVRPPASPPRRSAGGLQRSP